MWRRRGVATGEELPLAARANIRTEELSRLTNRWMAMLQAALVMEGLLRELAGLPGANKARIEDTLRLWRESL